jgi:hypothetical protein
MLCPKSILDAMPIAIVGIIVVIINTKETINVIFVFISTLLKRLSWRNENAVFCNLFPGAFDIGTTTRFLALIINIIRVYDMIITTLDISPHINMMKDEIKRKNLFDWFDGLKTHCPRLLLSNPNDKITPTALENAKAIIPEYLALFGVKI